MTNTPKRPYITLDGNEAAAYIAHQLSEVIAIYPITPSSGMGEFSDQWSSEGKTNIWGTVPTVIEMQSEAGAAGALHGALQAGTLATTFTSSQGLLLMIPNMYKIAGELTPAVMHVAARAVAAQGLSIFGDHSDVMAVRSTGWNMLTSSSVQEVMDMALISHAATLETRLPILHFFDGFRTSHEVAKVEQLAKEDLQAMISDELVQKFRKNGLTPEAPVLRGTAQNPDVFFQARETINPFYLAVPTIVQNTMDKFAKLTGRQYKLFQYSGAPDAERVIIIMGSGAQVAEETVKALQAKGEKVGMIHVHLYRPFSAEHFLSALPASVKAISVLDRTKEAGASGEPMYQDVVTVLTEAMNTGTLKLAKFPKVISGRYGLSSKEFTPAMVKTVFDELNKPNSKNHFTLGIVDDVTHSSLSYDTSFSTEHPKTVRALFYGLGADGTVGANKNSIKIIGEDTNNYAQGYFVYDSKKSGSITTSHLRFGPQPIQSSYLISKANFIACHQFMFLERIDMLRYAEEGAVFLLNSTFSADKVWDELPKKVQQQIIDKKIKFYTIDGYKVAKEAGMGGRVNTIMQTCFFAIAGVLEKSEAIKAIKHSIEKTYGKRGEAVVQKNFEAVDASLANLHQVMVPATATSKKEVRAAVPRQAPEFVQKVLAPIILGNGDSLPVSAMPNDGTYPTGTAKWEKRNIALEIPEWDSSLCIQCGKCVLVCPHSVIRGKLYEPSLLKDAPSSFKSVDGKWKNFPGQKYTLQVAPEDCTGCALCIEACPTKSKSDPSRRAINMVAQPPIREAEARNWDFFLKLPEIDRATLNLSQVKDVQLMEPLFEFSGACGGCGETPYIKLISQLFGDRMVLANATGCSSIYGGNLPTTPYTSNKDGRGIAWANSLFEDNAEFGMGIRIAQDKQVEYAKELVARLAGRIPESLAAGILNADQKDEAGIRAQRTRVTELKTLLKDIKTPEGKNLLSLADVLVKRSLWIMGGDGWAYDIGFGGLDHVLASGRNVNILVLDTEVYSNTGGQASKSTPTGAVAKFAAGGKDRPKKDLGMMAIQYGQAYVARVAMGYNDAQTLKALREAEAFNGPSLVIAYSHCIAHGYDLVHGLEQQKLAVQSGHWPLYRYNPDLAKEGKNPFMLDSKAPSIPLEKYVYNETRYTMLKQAHPETAGELLAYAQKQVADRWKAYEQLAATGVASTDKGSNDT